MATPADSLICPITLELFRDPVLAQDGHTYEREAIEDWIQKNGASPITRQPLSVEHLYPNLIVKQLVATFEKLLQQKNYQFTLDVDVRKKKGRPLFQTYGKFIYNAEWLPADSKQPEIILLKIDGARALKEASLYVNLTRHPHVVRTFGFVLDKNNDNGNNSVMLLQEYAPEGSLYELVQERSIMLDEKILIEIFLQIIDAMIFLAYNHVVHGDLACRNVLVFRFDETNPKNNIVKVTDFGLSRQSVLYSKTLGSAHTILDIIPTRYAAPEILAESSKPDNYTEKSDVYSMGVLMWEAYSRGALPWSKVEKDAEVIRNVMNSVYLPQPSNCSSKYWNIIIKTWSKLPGDRPTFEQLKRLLIEQIYLSVGPLEEQRTKESKSVLVKTESANDTMSQSSTASKVSLSNMNPIALCMKRVIQQKTIGEQQNKITPADGAEAAVLSPDKRATIPPVPSAHSGHKREYLVEVLIIGDSYTGKTALFNRYVHDSYCQTGITIGSNFALKMMEYDEDTVIRVQLWDTAGHERFTYNNTLLFKIAMGCFIVFDATQASTFESVTERKRCFDKNARLPDGSPVPCVLLASKCDLAIEGLVDDLEYMNEFCQEKGFVKCFQVSAKANINIETSFQFLINEIMKHRNQLQEYVRRNVINVTKRPESKRKSASKCFS